MTTYLFEKPLQFLQSLRFPSQMVPFKVRHQFFQTGIGVISFVKVDDVFVVSTEPITFEDNPVHLNLLWQSFQSFVDSRHGVICGYYFSYSFEQPGFEKIKLGESRLINLQSFSLCGKGAKEQRRALNYGKRKSYVFKEVDIAGSHLDKLYEKWQKQKKGPTVEFLLSKPGRKNAKLGERQFAVFSQNRLIAFVSFLPYGDGWYLDSMLHDSDYRFAMDFALVNALLSFQKEGINSASLGLCAFQNIEIENLSTLGLWSMGKASFLYNAKGIARFKNKYPGYNEARFLLLQKNKSYLKQVFALFRATYAL